MTAQSGRDRVFARALVLSVMVHLSAVTLFSIVIRFPRHDTDYFRVAIVESAPSRSLSVPAAVTAQPDGVGEIVSAPIGESLTLQDSLAMESLPAIELPTLPFEELSRLRLRQDALEVRSRYGEMFASREGTDLGLRLSSGLETVSETLTRLTFGGAPQDDTPQPISRPAPGFEAYVEWLSDPKNRQVFDVQPIEALRGVGPDALREPITLVFRVDRDGAVSDVFNPVGDTHGLIAAAAEALRGYRFAPLIGDGPEFQGGTFILSASGEGP
jgi:hypothetical protein